MYSVIRLTPMPWDDGRYTMLPMIRENLRNLTVFCLREYYDDPAYSRRYQNGFYLEIVGITDEEGKFWHNTGATRAPLKKLPSFIENYDGLSNYTYNLEGFLTWLVDTNLGSTFLPCFSTRHGDTERELYCHGDPYYIAKMKFINKHLPTNQIILTPRMQAVECTECSPVISTSEAIRVEYDPSNYHIITDYVPVSIPEGYTPYETYAQAVST